MLSRKQLWKKCSNRVKPTLKNEESDSIPNIKRNDERHVVFKNEESDSIPNIKRNDERHVVFKNEVKVVLIPQRIELRAVSLDEKLWYKSSDYQNFRENYIAEIFEKYQII